MKQKRFIPSQRIKGSDKEVFIINYEGAVIEVQRTTNLYEPLIVRLNGELLDTIPSKQNKEIEFFIAEEKHKLQVWNERVENNLIPKIFVKDGIAVVIDGIPVQKTLADPISKFISGKAFIWLLTTLLFVKAFIIPLSLNQLFTQGVSTILLFINIILFILSLSAALTFQSNPIRATWIALIVGLLELADYILTIVMIKEFGIVVILFTVLRLTILSSLILLLRNLKLILNFADEEFQELSEKPNTQKNVKRFTFPLKYVVIPIISIVILVGSYYIINEIFRRSKYPSIERDISLEFRTDLKVPELIPYRKGDKWGYSNSKGEIVIKPKYSSVEIFSDNNRLEVTYNELVGIIDKQGKEVIPCIYKSINELPDKDLYIVKKSGGAVGVIDEKNNIVIPFDYGSLIKHPTRDLYMASYKEMSGVIDEENNIVIPFYEHVKENDLGFDYYTAGLEFCDDFLIAKKSVKNKTYYGLLNYDGSILLDFQSLRLSRDYEDMLKGHLLKASFERDVYDPYTSEFDSETFIGIIDKSGKIILPMEYALFRRLTNGSAVIWKSPYYPPYEYLKGVINSDGEIVIPCEYEDIAESGVYDEIIRAYIGSYEKYIKVKRSSALLGSGIIYLYGLIDYYNQIVLPIQYEYILVQKQGSIYYFAIKDKYKNKIGLLNENKELVIPFEYDGIKVNYLSNWISVSNNNRLGVIDFNNKVIVPFEYVNGLDLSEGIAAAKYVDPDSIAKILKSNEIKGVDALQAIHIGLQRDRPDIGIYRNPDYKYSEYTTVELMSALSDTLTRRNFYKLNSKYLRNYCNYEAFCLAIVLGKDWRDDLPGKWGYLDEKGELIIDFIYDGAESFQNGLALVKFNNKWGVINKKGEVVIPIKYNEGIIYDREYNEGRIYDRELQRVKGYDLFKVVRNRKTAGFVDYNGVKYFENY